MNIGVDIRAIGKGRAVSRYTLNILKALYSLDQGIKFYLFNDSPDKVSVFKLPDGAFESVTVGEKMMIKDHFLLQKEIKKYPLDVFFHPDNTEFLFCHERSAVVIHDLIPWLLPNLVLSSDPFLNLRQKIYLKLQEKAILRSAKRILTVSKASREDIIKVLNVDPDLIEVTYEGVEDTFKPVTDNSVSEKISRKYNLPDNYIFYVGGLDERKNLLRLIHAFARIAGNYEIFLVIGGKTDDSDLEGRNSFLDLRKEVERLGLGSLVNFTGFIEEADLPSVYSRAKLFVYPSSYEGFGLPPLEAMACGVPVVASSSSSLPEICSDAALLVDPYKTEEFYSAIDILLKDNNLRGEYIKKGFINAGRFKWRDVGEKTLKALKSI